MIGIYATRCESNEPRSAIMASCNWRRIYPEYNSTNVTRTWQRRGGGLHFSLRVLNNIIRLFLGRISFLNSFVWKKEKIVTFVEMASPLFITDPEGSLLASSFRNENKIVQQFLQALLHKRQVGMLITPLSGFCLTSRNLRVYAIKRTEKSSGWKCDRDGLYKKYNSENYTSVWV